MISLPKLDFESLIEASSNQTIKYFLSLKKDDITQEAIDKTLILNHLEKERPYFIERINLIEQSLLLNNQLQRKSEFFDYLEKCSEWLRNYRTNEKGLRTNSFSTEHIQSVFQHYALFVFWEMLNKDSIIFLQNSISKATSSNRDNKSIDNQQKPQPPENSTLKKIELHFGFFQNKCPRKHKIILKETDFKKLIEWTVYYYENSFKIPEIKEPIKVVNTNKTYVQLAFRYLFKEIRKFSIT